MSILLFAGESYYAKGGMNDFQGEYASLGDAQDAVVANQNSCAHEQWDWWHLIDKATLEVVERSDYQAHGCDEDCYTGEGE